MPVQTKLITLRPNLFGSQTYLKSFGIKGSIPSGVVQQKAGLSADLVGTWVLLKSEEAIVYDV